MRLLVCNGIQPERLNAEGFSPSALSRGLSVSATPGMPSSSRKASERRENSRQGSRFSRSSRILVGVMIPRVTLRSTPGYEPLAPLGHSTFQVVLRVVLTQIFTELSTDFHGFYCGSVDRQVTVSLTEAVRRLSAMIITNKPRGVGAAGLIQYYLS